MKDKKRIDRESENCEPDDAEAAQAQDGATESIDSSGEDEAAEQSGHDLSEGPAAQASGEEVEDDPILSRRPPWMETAGRGYDPEKEESPRPTPSPQLEDMKARFKAESKCGPCRPLESLAAREKHLLTHSAAIADVSPAQKGLVAKNLFVHQMMGAVNLRASGWHADKMRKELVALYAALGSDDPVDDILSQLLIVSSSRAMSCHERANMASNPKALEVQLRAAEKFTRLTIDVIKVRENRHAPKSFRVGTVNVETGGQAIVGNVEHQTLEREVSNDSAKAEEPKASRRRKR